VSSTEAPLHGSADLPAGHVRGSFSLAWTREKQMACITVAVPDIGDFKDVPIADIHVKVGERIEKDQPIVSLESDKALIDVPAPMAGTITELQVKIGDRVSEGGILLTLVADDSEDQPGNEMNNANDQAPPPEQLVSTKDSVPAPQVAAPSSALEPAPVPESVSNAASAPVQAATTVEGTKVHAGPAVRRFARDVGIELARVTGNGPKGRITRADVNIYISKAVAQKSPGAGAAFAPAFDWPALPSPDFSAFGQTRTRPLSRIQKISGKHLHRNWVTIPHVTNHDEVDITELEKFRIALNRESGDSGPRVSILAFVMKACACALQKFPDINASLSGDTLIQKQYYHLGFAADTPEGLVVPVIKDVDSKSVTTLATEMATLAAKAREGKLRADDMAGGTFSISSLGGIGGKFFTPIINAPEVAILGLGRSHWQPSWEGDGDSGKAVPRLILPLSMSWDHRALDGAHAAKFLTYLAKLLQDFRRVVV